MTEQNRIAEPDAEAERFGEFCMAWIRLSEVGLCDHLGSAECRRVRQEWAAAGYPPNVTRFIVEASNRPA